MRKSKMVFVQIFMAAFTIYAALALNCGLIGFFKSLLTENQSIDTSAGYLFTVINVYLFAILLTCGIGLMGALLSQIAKSQKELALHVASGACPRDLYRLVIVEWTLRPALLPAALGLLCALTGIAAFGDALRESMSLHVSQNPALGLFAAAGVVAFCVLVAVYPAHRATRIHVIETLAA